MNGRKRTKPGVDPIERDAMAAEAEIWTIRIDPDNRQRTAKAIRRYGRNRTFWANEAIRAALASIPLTGVPPIPLRIVSPTTFKKK